jgi:hypothetical protein
MQKVGHSVQFLRNISDMAKITKLMHTVPVAILYIAGLSDADEVRSQLWQMCSLFFLSDQASKYVIFWPQ